MLIRTVRPEEVLPALHLVWEVYASDLAPLQSPEAVAGFQELIRYPNIEPRIRRGEVILFGAWEESDLRGVGGINRNGSVLLFYVKKTYQRQGIGRQLMQTMCRFSAEALALTKLTAEAPPYSAAAMSHLGFREMAPVQTVGGRVFIPMELSIAPAAGKPARSGKKKAWIIAAVVVLILALIALLAAMVWKEADRLRQSAESYSYDENDSGEDPNDSGDWFDDGGVYDGGDSGEDGDGASGIDQISCYEEENLPFQLKEESYLYSPDDTKTTYVDFEIYYPQLEGMADAGLQEQVNAKLKDTAMTTMDRIYAHPDTETRERVLSEESPVIADYVKYKTTYAARDYLCVVFEDYSYEGSQDASYVGLRACNINLTDGTSYEVKDILTMDGFAAECLRGLREEAQTKSLLSELTTRDFEEVLSGEREDIVYQPVFFADSDGIEVGVSLHYAQDDENDGGFGWVTAPFDPEELAAWKSDSTYWELLKQN